MFLGDTIRRAAGVCVLCLACADAPAVERSPAGYWRGTATRQGSHLPIAVELYHRGDSLHAAFSSPDLLLLDQPLREVAYDPPHIRFQAEELGEAIRFEGTVSGDTLKGVMHLAVADTAEPAISFTLVRAEPPDRPYRTEDVVFSHGTLQLRGSLFLPAGAGPHPAVVLVHGSSLNLADSYRFYADRFARAGVAALIYDKRGNGASGGDYRRATLDDLVADVAAAVHRVARHPLVDSTRIGLWGLSQGASLAPLVAQRVRVAFIVAVSGPGVPLGETAAYQDSIRLLRRGFSTREAAAAAVLHRRLGEWIRTGGDEAGVESAVRRSADLPWRRHTGIPRRLPSADERRGWYWASWPLDPVEWWRTVRVPALIVFGEDDVLVPARRSAERIEQALRSAGNREARVVVFPGGDHMLKQPPRFGTGANAPAWAWPRPVAGYMDTVTHWLVRQAGTRE